MRVQLISNVRSKLRPSSSRREPMLPGLLSAFLLSIGLLACASSAPPASVMPGAFEPLASDEGFLVVQVDNDLAIERLHAGSHVLVRDLQPGQHLWLIRMKAGTYRWSGVRLLAQSQGGSTIRPEAVGVLDEKEFEFDVEAGAVNYPGEIVIRMDAPQYGIESGITIRNRNHSAMAIRKLSKSHTALLAAHSIRYSGSSADEFLQFYTRARDARAKLTTGDAAPKTEVKR